MTSKIRRRDFIAGLGAGLLAAPAIVRAEGEPILIRAGALKLIHSIAPYFYDQFVPAGENTGLRTTHQFVATERD